MLAVWNHIENPLAYAIPFFFAFIGIEAALLRVTGDHETRTGYSAIDTRTSVSMGLGALVFATVAKLATMVLFVVMSTYAAPWHIPTGTWWSWVLLFVVVDLAWYCNHRFSHRVRIGWAAHQAHHSSEYFNLGTALRQKWNPWSEAIFWLPLPVLGFAPWTIYVAFAFNLIYQFFIHTETIGRLPRPLEFVLNTPSHHRVHHGSDPEYLDRNYGGILIIWDRMFGTFQQEIHTPTYGLTKPVGTYNVLKLQYQEYGNIIRDVRTARGWQDKLGYIFGPPGWKPRRLAADGGRQTGRCDGVNARDAIRIITRVEEARAVGTKGVPRPHREQLILDAAAEEFGRYGYAGAALSRVAAGADVSKPLVLSYFGSKDGLYVACIERAGANLIDRIEQVLSAGQPPVRMAQDTLAAIFTGLRPRPHDWNVINDRTLPPGGVPHEAARRVRNTIADQASRGVGTLAELRALDTDDLSLLTDIWMNMVTAVINWWLRHPERTAEEMTRRSQRVLTAIISSAAIDPETR